MRQNESGTTAMWRHLKALGVEFTKQCDAWIAVYAGSQAARDLSLGNCVWKAAEALGEVS